MKITVTLKVLLISLDDETYFIPFRNLSVTFALRSCTVKVFEKSFGRRTSSTSLKHRQVGPL